MKTTMQDFAEKFAYYYSFLYENGHDMNAKKLSSMVDIGNKYIRSYPKFVHDFLVYRHDFLTSDREVAAFAYTINSVLNFESTRTYSVLGGCRFVEFE